MSIWVTETNCFDEVKPVAQTPLMSSACNILLQMLVRTPERNSSHISMN